MTTAIGRCSIAPAEERATAGVTTRRAVRGHDDAGRAGALRAPADRAEVARVGDLVEHGEQRPLARGELVRVGVAVRLDPRDDALVVARAGELAQLALERGAAASPPRATPPTATARSVAQQLEHLAPAAQRLADRAAAVDEVACSPPADER